MNIILGLLSGIFVSVMIYLNGSLEAYVGNYASLLCVHISGFVLVSLSFIKKQEPVKRVKKSKLYLFAGILGIVVVGMNNFIFGLGGVLLALSGALAGQVISAAVMEVVRNRKTGEKLAVGKIISLCLVLPGAIIIGSRSNLPFYMILLSWVPGILLMIQVFMNSQNIQSLGFKKTLIVHYGSALALLLLMLIFIPIGDSFTKVLSGNIPIHFIVGGGAVAIFVVSVSGYLLIKLKPITYVLLAYSGQLSGAIFIDYKLGKPLSVETFYAMILIIIGLIIGEVKFRKAK